MQLTRLDHWLREKFLHETHIYTLRMPDTVPPGIIVEDLPESPGRRYKHRFIVRGDAKVERLVALLREGNQLFATRIVDRENWLTALVAPKGKSLSWRLIWMGISLVAGAGLVRLGMRLWENPELRQNLAESLEILKG